MSYFTEAIILIRNAKIKGPNIILALIPVCCTTKAIRVHKQIIKEKNNDKNKEVEKQHKKIYVENPKMRKNYRQSRGFHYVIKGAYKRVLRRLTIRKTSKELNLPNPKSRYLYK